MTTRVTREELVKELRDEIDSWSFDQLESLLNFVRASSKVTRREIIQDERKGNRFKPEDK